MSKNCFLRLSCFVILLVSCGALSSGLGAETPPARPVVRLFASDPTALEKRSDATVTFTRTGSLSNALTVKYTVSGSASNGVDYGFITDSVTIPPSAKSFDLVIHPLDDHLDLGNRTVVLTLATNAAYALGSDRRATVTLVDNHFNNVPPSVTLVSPTNRTVVGTPAQITLRAEASDSDNGIAKVSFYAGDHFLGSAEKAPYSLIWSNVPPGKYSLFARAADLLGESVLSPAVQVTVTNQPPTVSLLSPTNGASFSIGKPIEFSAVAKSGAGGDVAKVSFLSGGHVIGVITDPPYLFLWTNAPAGTFEVSATATDAYGTSTASKIARITVANKAPSVQITSPTNGANFPTGSHIRISADAADSDGKVARVRFYSGDRLLGTTTNAPYSLVWSNVAAGTYRLLARAVDANGAVAESRLVQITVGPIAPTIALVAPTNNANFVPGSTVTFRAETSAGVTRVTFYASEKLVGSSTNAPFSAVWTNIPAGKYQAVAKAESPGGTAVSKAVVFTVTNPSPVVLLTSPAANAVFGIGAPIEVRAEASDADGIAKVTFYAGERLLGTKTNKPYAVAWTNAAAGSYVLTAVATDGAGILGVSPGVRIIVSNAAPVVTLLTPTNSAAFLAPASISLSASATDAEGIAKLVFYSGSKVLASLANPPYTFLWTNVLAGTYEVSATAYDKFGVRGFSKTARVVVTGTSPVVRLLSPTNGAAYSVPAAIDLRAEASSSNRIAKVRFYRGGELIASVTNAPYAAVWNNPPAGTFSISAIATDVFGQTGISATNRITISNAAPRVKIIAPTNGMAFTVPAAITIRADATDPDDGLLKVAFYANDALLRKLTNAPYTIVWTNTRAGKYTLLAHATDKSGQSVWSVPVTITTAAAGVKAASTEAGIPNSAVYIAAVQSLATGETEISVITGDATTVEIQATANFTEWRNLGAVTPSGGAAIFLDATPKDGNPRFYRAVRQD